MGLARRTKQPRFQLTPSQQIEASGQQSTLKGRRKRLSKAELGRAHKKLSALLAPASYHHLRAWLVRLLLGFVGVVLSFSFCHFLLERFVFRIAAEEIYEVER